LILSLLAPLSVFPHENSKHHLPDETDKPPSDVFGITAGPPLHDPLAVAAVLAGTESEIPFYDFDVKTSDGVLKERFAVSVVTEGTHEEAHAGGQTGRTIATLLEPGQDGVRIPRGVNVAHFWRVIEDCIDRADAVNARNEAEKNGNGVSK
jgi:uridine nucleosidase